MPADSSGRRPGRVGRQDPGGCRPTRVRVEVHPRPSHSALHRGEPLPRHTVGRVRAERRAAVGADQAQRRGLHAEPVPPGCLPGKDAARRLLRQVRRRDDDPDGHQPRRREHPRRLRAAQAGGVRRSEDPADWPARSRSRRRGWRSSPSTRSVRPLQELQVPREVGGALRRRRQQGRARSSGRRKSSSTGRAATTARAASRPGGRSSRPSRSSEA